MLLGRKPIRRREFITLLGGAAFGGTAAAWPLAVRVQQPGRIPKIGFLYPGPEAASHSRIAAFLSGLRTTGYREPEQVELVSRTGDGDPSASHLTVLAAELIEKKVDVTVALSTQAVRIVQAGSAAIPIVAHDLETDPIASGLIKSYGRPGGNITGVFFDFPGFKPKWLELLKEVVPSLSRVGMLWDPSTGLTQLKELESAADQMHLKATVLEVSAPDQLENAFLAARQQNLNALVALTSPLFGSRSELLANLALHHKLPMVTLFPDFARAGGLMAYGPNLLDTYPPLGVLAGKILRGTKPAELAVERPSKYLLVVNLKTAKNIDIMIPPTILARADEVIE